MCSQCFEGGQEEEKDHDDDDRELQRVSSCANERETMILDLFSGFSSRSHLSIQTGLDQNPYRL